MREHSINLNDLIPNLQYEAYWKDVERDIEPDIHGWACGFFRNLFVLTPPFDELQSNLFMEYLAERAVAKSRNNRTIDQSVVYSTFERSADDRRRREFFFEPLKKAHYYNEFKGVHVIDLSEWETEEGLDSSPDFDRLKVYMRQAHTETRFLLWTKTTGDGGRLSTSIPGLSFKKIRLPYPSFEQIKSYASLSMKKNKLHPTENVLSVILQYYQDHGFQTDQFKKIDAAVAFLSEQASESRSRKPTKSAVEKLQAMMTGSYIAAERPTRKIGF